MEKLGEFRESLKETDWAWIAGFIDGEGCIGIQKGYTESKTTKGLGWYWYRPRLSVCNTDEDSVIFISKAFDCKLYERKMKESNLKPLYYIEICAIQVLRRVLPKIALYLKVKKVQCDLAYRLVCLPRGSGPKKEQIWKEFDNYSRWCGQKEVGLRNHGDYQVVLKRRKRSVILSQASG